MNIPYIRLEESRKLLPFDCGDKDLNEFFANDALDYQKGTYAMYFDLSTLI